MRNKTVLLILLVLVSSLFASLNAQLNVKEFGARGNGLALDTRFIQKAIDKAFEKGGGVIEVPPGTYLIGTLILKDNIELHLQPGAMLLGSPDFKDYAEINHKMDSRTNGLYAKHFMIFAEGAKNISITGTGIIHGNGLKNFQKSNPQNERPFMVRLVNCENVTIRDVKLLESANWTLHILGCRDVNIDGVVIENGTDSNRDGLDIDACNRVTVSNCRLSTGDDAIVMKSSNDSLCQNIAITNCIIRTRASAIKTGTESNGGFKNITVSNCVIKDLPRHAGIELMTVDGGIMKNIVVENITMENVATPFFIRLGNRARPYKSGQYVSRVADVRDIYLNNITVLNSKLPSSIIGLNNKRIENVVISNYTLRSSFAQKPVEYNEVPFLEFSYPAASYFKNLPAYGIYCRNVNLLHLDNIIMYPASGETRPAIVADRTDGLDLYAVKAGTGQKTTPLVHLRNSVNVIASLCSSIGPAKILFEKEDGTVRNMNMKMNILKEGQKEISVVSCLNDGSFFEDFPSELKFDARTGKEFKGLDYHDLDAGPVKFSFEITKRGSLQLCLLMLNESDKSEKVVVRYEGISQEFIIDWNEWGWAPITLLNEYPSDKKVDFEIASSIGNSRLRLSKAWIKYQDIRKTD